jgi:transcriptional regulator NrdR family protein
MRLRVAELAKNFFGTVRGLDKSLVIGESQLLCLSLKKRTILKLIIKTLHAITEVRFLCVHRKFSGKNKFVWQLRVVSRF